MDGCALCCNGVDFTVYFAGNDSQYSGAWIVVYSGGGIVVHDWCVVLFVAQNEVFTCGLASVCNWGQCVFLLCRIVRVYIGFIIKPAYAGFFIC